MTDVIGRQTVGLLKFRVLLDHRQSYISKQKSSSHLILKLARRNLIFKVILLCL